MNLFTPGPTEISAEVLSAMAQTPLYHRGTEFQSLFKSVQEGLKYLFQTRDDVYTLCGSGTAAMEFSIVNFLSSYDEIIVCGGGKFSERWSKIAAEFEIQVHEIKIDWGFSLSVDAALQAVEQNKKAKAFCIAHCETSTGALNNIKEIIKNIRAKFQGLIIVDCITTLGVHEFYFDSWGIDIAVCSSQKGLACPAGLAFVACSSRAKEFYLRSKLPKFYFDLNRYDQALQKNFTPFTPAINLVAALQISLQNIQTEGLKSVIDRHKATAEYIREKLELLNIEIFSKHPSNGVIACLLPYSNFIQRLKNEKQIIVSSGQDKLEGKIFRIGNMGLVSHARAEKIIGAIQGLL